MGSVSLEQLLRRAGVDGQYVGRLHELGALRGSDAAYEERDVHSHRASQHVGACRPVALDILAAVEAGTLSLSASRPAR